MIDVLIALLLLAVTLAGACATLVRATRAAHQALLTTRAVDMAADLAEALEQPDRAGRPEELLAEWRSRIATALPTMGMAPEQVVSLAPLAPADESGAWVEGVLELVLRWHGGPAQPPGEVRLPVMPDSATFAAIRSSSP